MAAEAPAIGAPGNAPASKYKDAFAAVILPSLVVPILTFQ